MEEIFVSNKFIPRNCSQCLSRDLEYCPMKYAGFNLEKQYALSFHPNCPLHSLEQHDKEVEKRVATLIYNGLALRLKMLACVPYDSHEETLGAAKTIESIMELLEQDFGVEERK